MCKNGHIDLCNLGISIFPATSKTVVNMFPYTVVLLKNVHASILFIT